MKTRSSEIREYSSAAGEQQWLTVRGAAHNNLKNIDVEIPLGRFVCVTGVSGSGKSSLVNDILREQLARDLNGVENTNPGRHAGIDGKKHLDKVIDIDQSPIGRTPRSNPATYIKLFDEIRGLFARLPDSKVRGYAPSRFSFNVATGEKGGGRCEACEGNGYNRVEMDFLADVWTPCPICEGRRFNHETLQVHYRGKSIFDVLDMDVQQALAHFDAIPKIREMLATLHAVGLDYIKLGQSSTTLSGGEAQRIKLARELVRRSTGRTLYLLDEPTTGLHFDDIKKLLAVLHGFVDAGNTVIVIEHNLDVIKTADWVIDLGPEGGDVGGYVIAAGTPEDVANCPASFTGQSLAAVLHQTSKRHALETPTRQSAKKPKQEAAARKPWAVGSMALAARRAAAGKNHQIAKSPNHQIGRDSILVVGAKEHNLKDVTVRIPRGAMTVCSGVSGSGKTSFALDTVYVEGQRRYVESLSAYARQFLGQFQKPKVDHVHGLSPAIAIEQKSATHSPRSTVGTVTEIYDYMRVLWARVGQPYCPNCNVPIGSQTSEEIVDRIVGRPEGTKLLLCAPVECGPGETWRAVLERCRLQGYVRARIDGEVVALDSRPKIDARRKHAVEIVVDRIVVSREARRRIADSVEHCLAFGKGVMLAVEVAQPPSTVGARPPSTVGARPPSAGKMSKPNQGESNGQVTRFSQHFSCDSCGRSFEELTPHHFSFNARIGWCLRCEGLGMQRGTSAEAIFTDSARSILDGGIAGWEEAERRPLLLAMLVALAQAIGFDPELPCGELTPEQRHALLFGLGEQWITVEAPPGSQQLHPNPQSAIPNPKSEIRNPQSAVRHPKSPPLRFQWKGFFTAIDEATRSSWEYRRKLEQLVTDVPCQSCDGGRIRPESRAVRLGGSRVGRFDAGQAVASAGRRASPNPQSAIPDPQSAGRTIVEVCAMPLSDAAAFFKSLKLDARQAKIAGELLHEIKSRLRFLVDVGLGYLTLSRAAPTLSGGEAQRIRLASQIGSGLTGVLYVLDEPTIGLHPRDNRRLIGALQRLRDLGNTLLMVEHDAEILRSADHLVDFGPGAGAGGGHVVGEGTPAALKRIPDSLTGRYLAGDAAISVPTNRRNGANVETSKRRNVETPSGRHAKTPKRQDGLRGALRRSAISNPKSEIYPAVLSILGARQHNLRNIDVSFPLGRFICVTGVSGSGKSSLVTEILYPALASRIHRAALTPGTHREILGIDHIDKVINVDQQPIGMAPSSNPATYTGVFDLVRAVFAKLPESKVRGYTINRFSFNRPGGRCDDCEGLGQVCHEMHFLPDVWVPCETCGGSRYQRETLEVRYKGKNIAEVLDMQVSQALEHFANVPKVRRFLQTLEDVGLGYLSLGQGAPTLSGGEAQRVKLAAELGRPSTGKTMYVLDEPTTGLHFDDLRKLLDVLHRLVDMGNTVICIEHNLDVIKTADWVIDLGPEAAGDGGRIVAEGTPEQVAEVAASHTGRLLKQVLAAGPHRQREVFDAKQAAAKAIAAERAPLLPEATDSIKMPWQRDGRAWHTGQRRSRDEKEIHWEGAALEFVVEEIERLAKRQNAKTPKRQNETSKRQNVKTSKPLAGKAAESQKIAEGVRGEKSPNHQIAKSPNLLPIDWNDRARVEIKAEAPEGLAQSAVPWFLHALTGGAWLLDLLFRTPAGTIDGKKLDRELGLKTLNDRDDIHAYGDEPRVRVRRIQHGLEQTRILVHDKKEIDTPAFRRFLETALAAYLAHVDALAGKGEAAEPWKQDGRKWHLSQKIIKPGAAKRWTPMTLTLLVGQIQKLLPAAEVHWDRKVFVDITTADGARIAKIITHQADGLRVDVHLRKGAFTPTQVRGLGYQQQFQRPGASNAELSFWLRDMSEVDRDQLKTVLLAAAEHVEVTPVEAT